MTAGGTQLTTETRRAPSVRTSLRLYALPAFLLVLSCVLALAAGTSAQNPAKPAETTTKTEPKPADALAKPEPFDGASVEKMSGQCVALDTEAGAIVIEMLPKAAPETVRSFLNLSATGALDTTTFSRVVKDFIVQGGNLSTGEKWSAELKQRMSRKLPDEPNEIKHVRGIVSMARGDEPNTATTHFFILLGEGAHLDGKFAAFGRVTSGMDVVDTISHGELDGEKPVKPVHIKGAAVTQCQK